MTGSSKTVYEIRDKSGEHGHRAHYLGENACVFPYDADALRSLAEQAVVRKTDQPYLDELLNSFGSTGELPFSWTPQEQIYISRHDDSSVIPYLLYRFKFRVLPKRREVTDFPVHVLVEPTSACNLRCVMCFQTDRTFTKKPFIGMIDMGLFRSVVDQAAEGGAGALSLGSRGEPFMHREMGNMLRYASDKKAFFDLKINTNATRFDEAICHDILSSNVNLIALSIDAHNKEVYEDIRVRGNWDKVVANVRLLRKIRDQHYPNSPAEIRVSGVRFRDDQDEDLFHSFWSEICDSVVFVRVQQRWNTYENPVHPDNTSPCDFLWERLFVWHDGSTNPCDEDYKSLLSPGSVHEQSIRDIWHGEALNAIREKHLSKRRGDCLPCDRCGV